MSRRPPVIHAYAGERNGARVRLTARVFRHAPAPVQRDGLRSRLAALWATWGTHEWPHAGVAVAGSDFRGEARADGEGFVRFDLPCEVALPERTAWERARLWLPDHPDVPVVEAAVLAPGRDGRLGVISDLDDTVLVTGRIGPRNWRRLLLHGPAERELVPGAGALFAALAGEGPAPQAAASDTYDDLVAAPDPRLRGERRRAERVRPAPPVRPFFYVSSSPWNLYAYLTRFLALNDLPAGVFALRDWGLNRATFGTAGHGAHKGGRIADILAFHPELRFVLIGDDGQGDVLAYAEAASAWPERIAGVFIRSTASDSPSRAEDEAIAGLRASGLPVFVGPVWDAGVALVETLGLDRSPARPALTPAASPPSQDSRPAADSAPPPAARPPASSSPARAPAAPAPSRSADRG